MKINDLILNLLQNSDLSNQQIADKVLEEFPNAKTSAKSVASVASVARRFGVAVPKRPTVNNTEELKQMLELAEAEIERLKAQIEELLEKAA